MCWLLCVLSATSRLRRGSIKPQSKRFSRRSLVKASMPLRCSQRSPVASCRRSLRSAPTGSPLARRSASAACCSNADSSRFTCGPNKIDLCRLAKDRPLSHFAHQVCEMVHNSSRLRSICISHRCLVSCAPIPAPWEQTVCRAAAWVP